MADGPYKLPEGWRWARLGEVARREVSIIQPSDNPSLLFNYIGLEHLDAGQWEEPEENWVYGAEIKSACVYFKQGYVLYAKLRPYLNKVVVCSREGIASTEFVPMIVHPGLLTPKYLGAYLRSPIFVTYASHNTTGSRMPRIRMEALWNAPIPLPPLEEQWRIVAKVEALMARVREARRLRAEAKKDAERLMQAALAEVLPRPGAPLPRSWRWVRLGEVCEHYRRSIDPRRFPDEVFLLYSIPAYDNDQKPEKVYGKNIRSSKLLIESAVCLFSKLNPRIPRAWVVQGDNVTRQIASTEFIPLKAYANTIDLFYLGRFLLSEVFLEQVRRDVTGATGSRQRLKPVDILNALVPLPPLEEQRRIVAYLDQVQQRVTALWQAQAETEVELQRLEQAILDRAFRGEL